jgi:chromosome partitioning protein
MLQASVGLASWPHVIVVGNEKGGSGKTTIAMHIAVALLKAGQRVATIDLDSRQKSLTHYIENRRAWARRSGMDLELPVHFSVARAEGVRVDENEAAEFAAFDKVITAVQHCHDFVVIDTPPHDSYLMRLAHSITDTLVTPLNDSFLDLDVLATVDPVTFAVTGVSHYAEMAREARRQRRSVDGALSDWVVVRNRLSILGSCNKQLVGEGLTELSARLAFRFVDGFAERLSYRELFPRGLTALDVPREIMACIDPSPFCLIARQEVETLLEALKLPIDDRGRRRAAARAQWFASRDNPLDTDDILAASDP